MKRIICPQHTKYVGKGRNVTIDSTNCSVCKKEAKVGPLKVARAFKEAADDMEFLTENPEYDPMGITVQASATKAIKFYVKLIHPDYAKNLVDALVEQLEQKKMSQLTRFSCIG